MEKKKTIESVTELNPEQWTLKKSEPIQGSVQIGIVEGQFKQKITYKDLKAGLPDLFASKTTLFYSAHYSQLGYDLFPAQKLTTKNPLKSSTVIKSYRFISFH